MIDLGYQFVTLLGDARLMAMKSAEILAEMRLRLADWSIGSEDGEPVPLLEPGLRTPR